MKTLKKLALPIIAGIFIASVLAFAAGVIAMKKIDPETKINQAVAQFSKTIKGTAAFGAFSFKLFPRPRLILYDAKISVLGKAWIFSKQVIFYPKIMPLFRGRIQVSKLMCDFVHFTLYMDPFAIDSDPGDSGFPIKKIMEQMGNCQAFLAKNHPGLRVAVRHGKIEFLRKDKQIAWLSEVNARLRLAPKTARIDLDCRSNLWQQAGLSMDMNFQTLNAGGRVGFNGLKLDNIPENILFFQSYRLARMSADLHATFKTNGSDEFIGEIDGSAPDLEIRKSGQSPVVLHCRRFKGDVSVSKNRITAKLDQLVLNAPQAVLSGRFYWDKTKPRADLEITGSIMDVAAARTAALDLVGQFRTTQKIFEIVRGGVVPRISFTAGGHTPADFKKAENIGLQGHLIHGKIVTPKSDLYLDEASGEAVLSKGILEGKNIRARLENSYAREGKFSIGMIGPKAPFHLEALIEADVAQLPPVLIRLIHNKTFQKEMHRLEEVQGRATGKLILGDVKDRIKPRVVVDGFHVSMKYLLLPLTFRLGGEKFLYDNRRIDLQNITGTIGKSAISGLDAVFDWQNAPTIFCRSKAAELMADEITPWLKSFAGLSPVFSSVDSVKGSIFLTETRIDGPLFKPAKWQFKAGGKFTNLAVETAVSPGSFEAVYGQFRLGPGQLDISNALVRNQDAEVSVGSLSVTDYLSGPPEIKTQFSGKVGARTLQWALNQTKLPLKIREDAQWTFSGGEFSHCPEEKTAFKGLIAVLNGPSLSLDVIRSADALTINELKVKDGDSEALLVLHQKEHAVDLDFTGRFNPSTVEKLFIDRSFPCGELTGNFKLHMDSNHPANATFDGSAEISDFSFSGGMELPVKIQKASLIHHNGVHKASGSFLWDNNVPFTIDGEIAFTQNKTTFDFNLFADAVNVDSLIDRIRQSRRGKTRKDNSRFWDPDIDGAIDIHVKQVNYGGHTWSPVRAHASFLPDEIRIDVSQARLCGFETPGRVIIKPRTIDLKFQPSASNLEIQKALPCLGGKNGLIQGNMDVVGTVSATGPYDGLSKSLNGDFHLTAKDGRIYRLGLLAKIFSILNITEIYRGTLPDLTQEGFQYSAIEAGGKIKDLKIMIDKAMIDGAAMDIAFTGEIAYKKKTMDIDLLVAPLKTIDFIVKNTPLVNDVLKGPVLSIPLKVKGGISNPEVTVLEPPSIGGGLLQIIENALKLPVKIIQPVFEGKKEKPDGVENNSN
jgi:hypothetical protein